MKALIKHNLLLLKRIHPGYIVFIAFIIGLRIKGGSGLFIITIPAITSLSMFQIESFNNKTYDILFSLPITRKELAKSKFFTMLIVYGITMLFVLVLYFFSVVRGTTKPIETLIFILELFITFPLSIFLGGLFGGMGGNSSGTMPLGYVLFMNILIPNVDIDLQLGKDKILDILVVIILLGLSIISYIGTKRSITDKYLSMEHSGNSGDGP